MEFENRSWKSVIFSKIMEKSWKMVLVCREQPHNDFRRFCPSEEEELFLFVFGHLAPSHL